ncbi:MAG: hypothetical protein COT26_01270 [Candidatus Kerfeldbacteria bacterium CG08_land_8_20_14_0_20_43_14]|uniref:Prepilin-type cleavage/methylation domain-containing protein n=1 Tax=Candidatus Kerfeldbacteria bacterium CG08_land_8_20_14_0_20_43_14 TaxID=2014246 RepID=A0A2H0YSU3_9BACT|nr:MAG: hypothetical protein COT26_01270 [Candidatus Kerfeldbacteria bacterium CG08_land_8_20_14_0_20_43_14]
MANQKGLTLIELMILIVFACIIAALAISKIALDADKKNARHTLKAIVASEHLYMEQHGRYTASINVLSTDILHSR